jgi:hypothetical protein
MKYLKKEHPGMKRINTKYNPLKYTLKATRLLLLIPKINPKKAPTRNITKSSSKIN